MLQFVVPVTLNSLSKLPARFPRRPTGTSQLKSPIRTKALFFRRLSCARRRSCSAFFVFRISQKYIWPSFLISSIFLMSSGPKLNNVLFLSWIRVTIEENSAGLKSKPRPFLKARGALSNSNTIPGSEPGVLASVPSSRELDAGIRSTPVISVIPSVQAQQIRPAKGWWLATPVWFSARKWSAYCRLCSRRWTVYITQRDRYWRCQST